MTTPRILIPRLFDEAWDSVVIATYGADLEFYERVLLRQLRRTRNRVMFCDGRQVTRKLAEPDNRTKLRHLNQTYVVAPIWTNGAAHAKLIMLLSQDRGLLVVGSGNLSLDGYASQGECFSMYRWSGDDQGQIGEFLAARSFINQMSEQRLVDPVVGEFVRQAWQDAPWLYGKAQGGVSRVRHNLEQTLLDQFVEAVSGQTVDELVVHAPFYDHGCQALAELIQRTSPKVIKVLLQEQRTSVDPGQLALVLAGAPGRVDVRSVKPADKGTFLHAKFLIARCDNTGICLQGSPNISTPALLSTHPDGNIELANLLVGHRNDFDHLITGLLVSPNSVDISQLGLSIASDSDDDHAIPLRSTVAELRWVPPQLTGVFYREVRIPPQLFIEGAEVEEVAWEIGTPSAGTTRFTVKLGDKDAAKLNRVAALGFTFENGEESLPTFPYHLNTLKALASGQRRTDLLKQAGGFELDDEELEELLAQLEEALVVDGRSIWRMLKRNVPSASDDETSETIPYDELDWDTILSHPKLAQYRTYDQRSLSNPTALGILLTSIAERITADVQRGRTGEAEPHSLASPSAALDDLAKENEAEDEEAAEKEDLAHDRRRATARSKAKRQFHSFVKRFVNGLTDKAFVRHVGPSVIVPSYVIFNHLCWKLIQIDLADPLRLIDAQTTLWRFFWGDNKTAGYFATLSTGEQKATLKILKSHHSEAVLLCSIFQAYKHTRHENDHRATIEVRDAWRTILLHPLFKPTQTAIDDSATQLQNECKSAPHLINMLDRVTQHVAENEPRASIGRALGCQPRQVIMDSGQVNRGSLGPQVVPIHAINDLDTLMTPDSASHAFSALTALDPKIKYIRLEDRSHDVIAFADYERNVFLYANRATNDSHHLDPPAIKIPPWRAPLATLHQMAGVSKESGVR